jgi:hypothetical protein
MNTKNKKRSSFNITIKFHGSPEMVFPFLCPTREYEWIDWWTCNLLYSNSGYAEELCVFQTNMIPFGNETWVCSRYEPSKLIQYTRFNEKVFIRNTFSLVAEEKDWTTWNLEFIFTALNEEGDKIISGMSAQAIDDTGNELKKRLNYFLENKRMLK